ncbi:hypothetical protein Q31a_55650 [Aureliella helgolandensis]|uniref:Uncharacterized protein n=1 Tax=Aureliella helgolandensis TaxID=2527968 RepID=A0A518GF37_9BACT|nr:hypothetical protein Q31a_55650 [Aureliella helgolandensis]
MMSLPSSMRSIRRFSSPTPRPKYRMSRDISRKTLAPVRTGRARAATDFVEPEKTRLWHSTSTAVSVVRQYAVYKFESSTQSL